MRYCFYTTVLLTLLNGMAAAADVQYGEPIRLKGKSVYFTSWKYVRPGEVAWSGENFTPRDIPRGIRLAAQKSTERTITKSSWSHVFDGGTYKMWAGEEDMSTIRYYESTDGIQWTEPELGLFESAGNKRNNICFRSATLNPKRNIGAFTVFIDPSSKEERFKAVYDTLISREEWNAFAKKYPGELDSMAERPDYGLCALCGLVSPDGIHWTSLPEPLCIHHADTHNTCYYDEDRKIYVAYLRTWQVDSSAIQDAPADFLRWGSVGRRCIGRSVSTDFRHFSKPEIVVSTGPEMTPSHVWYTNAKTTLPDAPDNHVMFPWLWEQERDGGSVYLLSSPDGWTWSRVPGDPVLSTGKSGQPDGAFIQCQVNLLEYPGNKWGIPFFSSPTPHKYPAQDNVKNRKLHPGVERNNGIAFWPKGRLVALQADQDGAFTTVAIIPPGTKISLNADVASDGFIKVAVEKYRKGGIAGRAFHECMPIRGDSLAHAVSWDKEQSMHHDGEAILLKFELRKAKLYAIRFHE